MDALQIEKYGNKVEEWKRTVETYGRGWNEDHSEIPVDYKLGVTLHPYTVLGDFVFPEKGGIRTEEIRETFHRIVNPVCSITVGIQNVKAHLNRLIRSVEEWHENRSMNIWDFVTESARNLQDSHHGDFVEIKAAGVITKRLRGAATGIPSTQKWEVCCGARLDRTEVIKIEKESPDEPNVVLPGFPKQTYYLMLETPVMTACPFVAHETGGNQTHTQRSYIKMELWSDSRFNPYAIFREINTRLVPLLAAMQMPDEVIQVLQSYAGPTFTEDAAVRVIKILRGITAEFLIAEEPRFCTCKVTVRSEDSHSNFDIVTDITSELLD